MRVLIQRVSTASVTVDGNVVGKIEDGLMLLVGIAPVDDERIIRALADKIVSLRIFEDDEGKMNRSLLECGGSILSVSQFTLYGDCRNGRRPSFTGAAKSEHAHFHYEKFNTYLREQHEVNVETGIFGAMMDVSLVNQGPVTIWLDSDEIVCK